VQLNFKFYYGIKKYSEFLYHFSCGPWQVDFGGQVFGINRDGGKKKNEEAVPGPDGSGKGAGDYDKNAACPDDLQKFYFKSD